MGRSKFGNFLRDFSEGLEAGTKFSRGIAMAQAAGASPETIETQKLGAETTTGTEGKVYDSDTGQYVPKYMDASKPSGMTDSGTAQNMGGAQQATEGPTPTFAAETVTQHRLGNKTQDIPFTEDQIGAHRLKAQSDMALRFGDTREAARLDAMAERRRQTADDQRIRDVLADPSGKPHVRPFANDSTAEAPKSAQGSGSQSAMPGLERQKSYLETVGPRVTEEYLRQGKIAEAKAWRDFSESEGGHKYANDFAQAQRLVTVGDYDTAAPVLERLYNRGYPDGRQAKLTSVGDGNFKLDVFDQKNGQLLGSKTMPAADMGKLAISALAPTKLVEFMAQQHGKREAEAASLNKSIEVENLRQAGQDTREDRRDDRLRMSLDQRDRALERRLANGGLTLAQQRSNSEIDAAREAIAGLSPQDIMRRTAKATNTGRENPEYDPGLARQAALANRRKIGDDEMFDQPKPKGGDVFAGKPLADLTEGQLRQFSRAAGAEGRLKIDSELARRSLAGMRGMESHTLGEYVEGKGFKVFDSQGSLVSYMRRK